MIASLQHDEVVLLNEVDQAMFGVDSSRPAALQDVSQRLRFADAGEGITQRVLDQID